MKRTSLFATAAAFVALAGATPVAAQSYKVDLGIKGGGSYYTPAMNDHQLGDGAENVKFAPDWRLGADLSYWITDRVGLRANFGYTDNKLKQSDTELVQHVNLWDGTGDLLIRLADVPDNFDGAQFLPYLALGAGKKWINPATNTPANNGDKEGAVFNPTGPTASNYTWYLSDESKWEFLGALGALWRTSPKFGVSLEVGDRAYDTPIYLLNGTAGNYTTLTGPGEDQGSWVHEIYGEVGLHMLLGVQPSAPKVVVAPPPPPSAPPAPAPPAPKERAIQVCVVDPTVAAGTRMVDATYVIDTGDTVVVSNGTRRPLSSTVGNVMLAPQTDWYVAGQPMSMTVNRRKVEFVTYGSPRTVESSQLLMVGTVNGMPVYAARQDLGDAASQWESAVSSATNRDLATLLGANASLRTSFNDVQVLYVPLQTTGCVFQGLQRVEEVRKGRGE